MSYYTEKESLVGFVGYTSGHVTALGSYRYLCEEEITRIDKENFAAAIFAFTAKDKWMELKEDEIDMR